MSVGEETGEGGDDFCGAQRERCADLLYIGGGKGEFNGEGEPGERGTEDVGGELEHKTSQEEKKCLWIGKASHRYELMMYIHSGKINTLTLTPNPPSRPT